MIAPLHCALALLLLISGTAQAQLLLTDTSFTTDIGYNNAKASSIAKPHGSSYGIDMTYPAFGVADDFTVPAGKTWYIDTVTLYGYQTGSSTSSAIAGAYLQVNSGTLGGPVILSNGGINRLVGSGWTGIYRVDTVNGGLTDTLRPVMYLKLRISPALMLTPGTYWMSTYATGMVPSSTVWCPPKVNPDRSYPAGQNAVAYTYSIAAPWTDSTAAGSIPLGMNFLLSGSADTSAGTAVPAVQNDLSTLQLQPNPARSKAVLSFRLDKEDVVTISLLGTEGRLLKQLVNSRFPAGQHALDIDVSAVPAGTYFIRFLSGTGIAQAKMLEVVH